MEKISAICSASCAWVAFISLKDMQVYTTILAGIVAIISGSVSIYLNIKKIKK